MRQTFLGTAVGLALGFALAFGSFGKMLVVAVFAAVGWGLAKVVAGEVDLTPYLSGRRSSR